MDYGIVAELDINADRTDSTVIAVSVTFYEDSTIYRNCQFVLIAATVEEAVVVSLILADSIDYCYCCNLLASVDDTFHEVDYRCCVISGIAVVAGECEASYCWSATYWLIRFARALNDTVEVNSFVAATVVN